MQLNALQNEAVKHFKGPCLVLAGPGSGKTTIIINRVKYLIENYNISPHNILVITFTKAAAEEMKERFEKLSLEHYNVSFGTFHALFFRIIRSFWGYNLDNVLNDDEKNKVLKKIVANKQISFSDEEEFFSNLINDISRTKNELLNPENIIPMSLRSDAFCNVYYDYEKYKKEENKIDFDDMIVKCYEALNTNAELLRNCQNRYKFILIDEFQDINKAQHECIKLLKGENNNIFAVGDDDQSIYGFRGARPEFLLDFKKDFKDAKIISTDINYRSTEEIIKLSNAVIRQNKRRFEKNISGTGLNGKKPSVIRSNDISSEADLIAKKVKELIKTIKQEEIAVIYRTNIQSRAIIDAFMDYNISFQIKDASPSIYSHWIAKDLAAYLYLSLDKSDNLALERIINKPSRYINKIAVQNIKINCADGESVLAGLYSSPELKKYQLLKIEELIFHLNQIVKKSPYEAVKYIRKNVNYDEAIINYAEYRNINPSSFFEIINELEEASKGYETIEAFLEHMETVAAEAKENKHKSGKQYGVMLTTMHSAKGLEFDTVFIAGAVDGIIPHEKSTSEEEIEEERRLFYVGMTRAKNSLYISLLKTRYDKDVKPTRFLNGLLKKSNTK